MFQKIKFAFACAIAIIAIGGTVGVFVGINYASPEMAQKLFHYWLGGGLTACGAIILVAAVVTVHKAFFKR